MFRFGIARCCCGSTPTPPEPNTLSTMYINFLAGDPNYWATQDRWIMNNGTFPGEPFPLLVAQSGIGINTRPEYCSQRDPVFPGNCLTTQPEVTNRRIGQLEIYRPDYSVFDDLIGETVSVTRTTTTNGNTERYSIGWGDPVSAGPGFEPQTYVPRTKYIPSWGTPNPQPGFNEEYYGSKECKFKIYGTSGLQLSTATVGQAGYIPKTADEINAAAGNGISMDWDLKAELEAAGDYLPALDVSTIVQAMVDSAGFAGSDTLVLYFVADSVVPDADAVMMTCGFAQSGSFWLITT